MPPKLAACLGSCRRRFVNTAAISIAEKRLRGIAVSPALLAACERFDEERARHVTGAAEVGTRKDERSSCVGCRSRQRLLEQSERSSTSDAATEATAPASHNSPAAKKSECNRLSSLGCHAVPIRFATFVMWRLMLSSAELLGDIRKSGC